MEALACYSAVGAEIARRQTAADLDARHRAELRAAATEAIARLDAVLATARKLKRSGSWCGRCGGSIGPPSWQCANCSGNGHLATWTRAAADARAYGLDKVYTSPDGAPIEFTHFPGADVLSVR